MACVIIHGGHPDVAYMHAEVQKTPPQNMQDRKWGAAHEILPREEETGLIPLGLLHVTVLLCGSDTGAGRDLQDKRVLGREKRFLSRQPAEIPQGLCAECVRAHCGLFFRVGTRHLQIPPTALPDF